MGLFKNVPEVRMLSSGHHCDDDTFLADSLGAIGVEMGASLALQDVPKKGEEKEKEEVEEIFDTSKKTIMNAVLALLGCLGEDVSREGLIKTPHRVACAFLFATKGYKQVADDIVGCAMFPEAGIKSCNGFGGGNGGMVVVRNIQLFSICEACLLPVKVCCHVAYIPSNNQVVGLSKLARVADIYARRLQNPQRLAQDISKALLDTVKPLGVGVVVQSHHLDLASVNEPNINQGPRAHWRTTLAFAGDGRFQEWEGDSWSEFLALLHMEGFCIEKPGEVEYHRVLEKGWWCPRLSEDETTGVEEASCYNNNNRNNNNNNVHSDLNLDVAHSEFPLSIGGVCNGFPALNEKAPSSNCNLAQKQEERSKLPFSNGNSALKQEDRSEPLSSNGNLARKQEDRSELPSLNGNSARKQEDRCGPLLSNGSLLYARENGGGKKHIVDVFSPSSRVISSRLATTHDNNKGSSSSFEGQGVVGNGFLGHKLDNSGANFLAMIEAVESILFAIGEDGRREELRSTPRRFVKWLLSFHREGSSLPFQLPACKKAVYDANDKCNIISSSSLIGELEVELDIWFCSQCEHHLLPFYGVAHLAYFRSQGQQSAARPALHAIVQRYSKRLQVQERLTKQIAKACMHEFGFLNVMVVLEASHICMASRGVEKLDSSTATVAATGCFANEPSTKVATLRKISGMAVRRGWT